MPKYDGRGRRYSRYPSASIRAPYQGEDSRVTLLRTPFFAGKSVEQEEQPDNLITISIEMARFYQLITRGSIPRTAFLESEYNQLKVKHSALEKKELEWERTITCLNKSNSNLREQLDAVERGYTAQGEVTIEIYTERKTETTEEEGEGRSRKRRREE
ncbi:hypothetical protein BKA65DRAFT_471498 [Rhexocercosporidium sp. MPI-PUGE-AT-0058]|nr:hypothetical protein BKA65DRAFT_471498 [Rhexocercosporidium sp. MPI-PUGE-AT-0058]